MNKKLKIIAEQLETLAKNLDSILKVTKGGKCQK